MLVFGHVTMRRVKRRARSVSAALLCGVAVPLIYFGCQVIAARFYRGYSFLTQSASELGSPASDLPQILNFGAMATGVCLIVAGFGFAAALPQAGSSRIVAWLTCLAMLSAGASGVWASHFPLPDPRHNPRLLGAGAYALPILLLLAFWPVCRAMRKYLLVNAILFAALIPLMAGLTAIDTRPFGGLLQRVAAAVVYVPVGVAALRLSRRAARTWPRRQRSRSGRRDGAASP
ncbi:MAG TPA: DUF998 domain-containing protein [Thermoanaerobaculia bacterium]|nr:DUF998 domain-containing protein [Thermoanaerobaculia bacterium]